MRCDEWWIIGGKGEKKLRTLFFLVCSLQDFVSIYNGVYIIAIVVVNVQKSGNVTRQEGWPPKK